MRYLVLLSLITLASACHPHADAAVSAATATTTQASKGPFSLPSIPDVLRTPSERAAYLIEHYWDHTPLDDTLVTHQPDRLEQFWVDYLNILQYSQDSLSVVKNLQQLVATAALSADSTTLPHIIQLARHYIFDPDSPVRQTEDLYLPVLEAALDARNADGNPLLPLEERERCLLDQRMALQNREGTLAANFIYQLPNGRTSTLHSTESDPLLLLLFYDPDCEHCMETIEELKASHAILQALADRRLTILAVDTEGSASQWRKSLTAFPDSWIVGFDSQMSILTDDLYSLRSMPTLLLLDNSHRVIRKNPSLKWLSGQLTNGN